MADDTRIRVPKSGLTGIKVLIGLRPAGVKKLCDVVQGLSRTLDFRALANRLAKELRVAPLAATDLMMGALLPLNHLRVSLELEPARFLGLLAKSLEQESSEDWCDDDFQGWKAVEEHLVPLFDKDNYFSVINQAFQLLMNRNRPVQDVKVLSELKYVYSEDATSALACMIVYSLLVEYEQDGSRKQLILPLELDDLGKLALEVDRARLKSETVSEAASGMGVDLLAQSPEGAKLPDLSAQYREALSCWQTNAAEGKSGLDARAGDTSSSPSGPWLHRAAMDDESDVDRRRTSHADAAGEPPAGRPATQVAAISFFESVSGRKARCLVQVAGAELPVELPVRVLEARGLKPGARFLWWMREDGSVTAQDIDRLPPDHLSAAEEADAQRLYNDLCTDIASGDDWGMEPGLGR